ncbi:MAG: hypothetical protein AAFY02_16265 [Pseudomonadota bacterium]
MATLGTTLRSEELEALAEREEGFRQLRDRIEEKKERAEARADAEELTDTLILLQRASPERIAQLNDRMDLHQEKLVEALLANQDALDETQERLDGMLEEAYVLEDGRRVFKTRDGTQVFDEQGQSVQMDADAIENHRPVWETFQATTENRNALRHERALLLTYQQRLDEAQERLESGDLSTADMDELDNLMMDAPSAVRVRLPESDPASPSNTQSNIAAPAVSGDSLAPQDNAPGLSGLTSP